MASQGKVAIVALASVLVVTVVVAAIVIIDKKSDEESDVNSSTKAENTLCATTNYKETCLKSMSNVTNSDPKKLMQASLYYAVDNLKGVIRESETYKQASKDPSVKDALDVCDEVLNNAVDDLRRSIDKIDKYSSDQADEALEDLKTWLSAVGTYHETCMDAFENTSGDTGEKMKKLLETGNELASNALAMIDGISSVVSTLDIGSFLGLKSSSSTSRKLLVAKPAVIRALAENPQINAVVAKDGSGQFKTISDAIKTIPSENNNMFVILVKAGVYAETVIIPRHMNKVVLLGEGPTVTKITAGLNFADGVKTFQTATVGVDADDFVAKNIGFENSAGANKHQAVALRVTGDRAVILNCHIDGYQDSLYAHTYRQFYRDCTISGTIDFVFGDALSVFQNCTFVVRRPMDNQACMVTAQGRKDARSEGAIIIVNSKITAEPAFLSAQPAVKAYLGRPWKELSRTVIMRTEIGGFISPEGWAPWNGSFALDTLYYVEYQNSGPGSDTSKRVTWKGIQHIDDATAEEFTPQKVFHDDSWITGAGVPYAPAWIA